MRARSVKISTVDQAIVPLGKAFEKPGKETDHHGMSFYKAIASSAFLKGLVYEKIPGTSTVEMILVQCIEHKRPELVFTPNYRGDLHFWYEIGRHPRFSVTDAFIKEGQTSNEIGALLNESGLIKKALKTANTRGEFVEIVRPRLMTNLYAGGRSHRVTHSFKERFKKRDFTVDDFFQEQNQEIRRVILRVVPIHEVINRLKLISEDEEGKIYETEMRRRYLYVKCPSTGQEYLLEVPDHMDSPKEARRWTFDLPADAVFAKEA